MDSLTTFVFLLGGAGLLFDVLSYYGYFTTDFTQARYKSVGGEPHAGPVLEGVWMVLLAVSVWFLGQWTFSDAVAASINSAVAPGVSWVLIVAAAVVVGWQTFRTSIRDMQEVMPGGPKHNNLFPEMRQALRDYQQASRIDSAKLKDDLYRNSIPFYGFNLVNLLLQIALVGLIGYGLWIDFGEVLEARGAVLGSAPRDVDTLAQLQPQLEGFFFSIRDYEAATLDLGRDLTAVLAVCFVLAFWFLGTKYHTIYTESGEMYFRIGASLVLLFIFPLLILGTYAQLVWVSNDVSEIASALTAEAQAQAQQWSAEELSIFNDVIERIEGRAEIEGYWSKLATSTGGIVLFAGAIFSIWQDRGKRGSYLKKILPTEVVRVFPERLRKWFRAVIVPAEPESSSELGSVESSSREPPSPSHHDSV